MNLQPPPEMFPYQLEGSEFLAQKRFALLADEMGLGKTVQAIRGLDRIRAQKVIIVCPSIARINWLRELEFWAKTKRTYLVAKKLSEDIDPKTSLIVSFEFVVANLERLKQLKFDCLVVDEAHFLKDPGAKRTKAIFSVTGLVRYAKRCWLLTGTPAPNNPAELWVMLYSFGCTVLKYEAFTDYFCLTRQASYGKKIIGANRAKIPELKELLKPILLRRLKRDVMKQLPPITYGHINVEPGPVDLEVMASFTQYFIPKNRSEELYAELDRQYKLLSDVWNNMKVENADSVAAIQAISSSVSTIRRYIGLQKVKAAVELVKRELEANAYQKIVIFAVHRDVIEEIRAGLRDFNPVTLYGKHNAEKKQKNVDRFQNNKHCRVFIGNIQAAGVAVTLTASHNVLFVEQDWVPGNNAQAVMRCHRIGQENPVHVRFLSLDGTLDTRIMYIIKIKTRDLTEIFDLDLILPYDY